MRTLAEYKGHIITPRIGCRTYLYTFQVADDAFVTLLLGLNLDGDTPRIRDEVRRSPTLASGVLPPKGTRE
jgi:hypothetical protein